MKKRAEQVPMSYTKHGGARLGAGRPKRRDGGVAHRPRRGITGREPVHVTVRVLPGIPLRRPDCFRAVCRALIAGADRFAFRVVGLSIQGNHLHLLTEPASAQALERGVKGLCVRLSKALNRVLGRTGKVVEERYHAHVLRTPAEVRRTQAYVRGNSAGHARRLGRPLPDAYVDPFTVGFFGAVTLPPPPGLPVVVAPTTWLYREGWRVGARVRSARGRAPAKVPTPGGRKDRRGPAAESGVTQLDLSFVA